MPARCCFLLCTLIVLALSPPALGSSSSFNADPTAAQCATQVATFEGGEEDDDDDQVLYIDPRTQTVMPINPYVAAKALRHFGLNEQGQTLEEEHEAHQRQSALQPRPRIDDDSLLGLGYNIMSSVASSVFSFTANTDTITPSADDEVTKTVFPPESQLFETAIHDFDQLARGLKKAYEREHADHHLEIWGHLARGYVLKLPLTDHLQTGLLLMISGHPSFAIKNYGWFVRFLAYADGHLNQGQERETVLDLETFWKSQQGLSIESQIRDHIIPIFPNIILLPIPYALDIADILEYFPIKRIQGPLCMAPLVIEKAGSPHPHETFTDTLGEVVTFRRHLIAATFNVAHTFMKWAEVMQWMLPHLDPDDIQTETKNSKTNRTIIYTFISHFFFDDTPIYDRFLMFYQNADFFNAPSVLRTYHRCLPTGTLGPYAFTMRLQLMGAYGMLMTLFKKKAPNLQRATLNLLWALEGDHTFIHRMWGFLDRRGVLEGRNNQEKLTDLFIHKGLMWRIFYLNSFQELERIINPPQEQNTGTP